MRLGSKDGITAQTSPYIGVPDKSFYLKGVNKLESRLTKCYGVQRRLRWEIKRFWSKNLSFKIDELLHPPPWNRKICNGSLLNLGKIIRS